MSDNAPRIHSVRVWQSGPFSPDVIDVVRACGDVAGRTWAFSVGEGFGFPGASGFLTDPMPDLPHVEFALSRSGGSPSVAIGWHVVSGVELLHRAAETSQITVGCLFRLRPGRPPLGPPQLVETWSDDIRIQHPDADLEIRCDYESDWLTIVYEGDAIEPLELLGALSDVSRAIGRLICWNRP